MDRISGGSKRKESISAGDDGSVKDGLGDDNAAGVGGAGRCAGGPVACGDEGCIFEIDILGFAGRGSWSWSV